MIRDLFRIVSKGVLVCIGFAAHTAACWVYGESYTRPLLFVVAIAFFLWLLTEFLSVTGRSK